MKDEKDKIAPEPPKKHPDPFANLTDQDWADAMVRGKEFSDAKDERIGKAIKGEVEGARLEADARDEELQGAIDRFHKKLNI